MKTLLCITVLFSLPVAPAWSYDTTVTYSGGKAAGLLKLDGRSFLDSTALPVADTVRFDFGLTVSHMGIPNFGAACVELYQAAFRVQGAGGPAGFAGPTDTVWSAATRMPDRLLPLDSLLNYSSQITHTDRYLGDGLIHSADHLIGCRGTDFATQPGFHRIVYFRNGRGTACKLQVAGFELDSEACPLRSPGLCKITKYVLIRYAITDDPQGIFPEGPSALPARPRAPRTGPGPRTYVSALGRKLPASPLPKGRYPHGRRFIQPVR